MSGIVALLDGYGLSLEEHIFGMLSHMLHRGEKEHAYEMCVFPGGALGLNRLEIAEQDEDPQPCSNKEGTIFAVLDGHIYNYHELRSELLTLGYRFQTHTETEVLVHGYCAWRDKLAERLDGMFSFIVYDLTTETFIAARDHIGIKPLYYLYDGRSCTIASEMKALLSYGQQIQVLPPGHLLTRQGVQQYFHLSEDPINASQSKLIAMCRDLLTAAVVKQLPTEQPVGVMFSGGIDSAILLSIATHYNKNIVAISTGFKGAADIEVAQRYCREHNIQHLITYLQMDDLVQDLPEAVYYCETFEPINIIDTCVISPAFKLAKELAIKVVLCGDGSDELFAGYDLFQIYPNPHYLMNYRVKNEHCTDLQRIDRSSMRYTIEARVPYLDKNFLQFAYRVPMIWKIRDGINKWLLRETFKNDLPAYIAQRPKVRMPDGSGLYSQLLDFACQQQTAVDPSILAQLHMSPTDGAYFLEQYLRHGYPVPLERYKKPGLDYSPHGYFDFVTQISEQAV